MEEGNARIASSLPAVSPPWPLPSRAPSASPALSPHSPIASLPTPTSALCLADGIHGGRARVVDDVERASHLASERNRVLDGFSFHLSPYTRPRHVAVVNMGSWRFLDSCSELCRNFPQHNSEYRPERNAFSPHLRSLYLGEAPLGGIAHCRSHSGTSKNTLHVVCPFYPLPPTTLSRARERRRIGALTSGGRDMGWPAGTWTPLSNTARWRRATSSPSSACTCGSAPMALQRAKEARSCSGSSIREPLYAGGGGRRQCEAEKGKSHLQQTKEMLERGDALLDVEFHFLTEAFVPVREAAMER